MKGHGEGLQERDVPGTWHWLGGPWPCRDVRTARASRTRLRAGPDPLLPAGKAGRGPRLLGPGVLT